MIYLINDYKKIKNDSHHFLKEILLNDYKIDLDDLVINYNEYGKPYLNHPIHFSITHTNKDLAIVIDNQEVGIDMEEVRKYEPLVSKRLFTLKEQKLVRDNDYLFTKIFVMKEAYAKYDGRGLGEYLSEIEVSELDNMHVIDNQNLIIATCNSNNNEIKEL